MLQATTTRSERLEPLLPGESKMRNEIMLAMINEMNEKFKRMNNEWNRRFEREQKRWEQEKDHMIREFNEHVNETLRLIEMSKGDEQNCEDITDDDTANIATEPPAKKKANVSWSDQVNTYERIARCRFAKFDYILDEKADFSVWRDKLIAEVKANGSDFLLSGDVPFEFGDDTKELALSKVRSFIVSKICERYHHQVMDVTDVSLILQKLEKIAAPTSSM